MVSLESNNKALQSQHFKRIIALRDKKTAASYWRSLIDSLLRCIVREQKVTKPFETLRKRRRGKPNTNTKDNWSKEWSRHIWTKFMQLPNEIREFMITLRYRCDALNFISSQFPSSYTRFYSYTSFRLKNCSSVVSFLRACPTQNTQLFVTYFIQPRGFQSSVCKATYRQYKYKEP